MAQFRVTSANFHGAVFALDGKHFAIGRAPGNQIQLSHASISKQHAMITVDQGDFKYWDLHSTNGTFVNGERTVFRHLQDGDRLVLGEIHLHFDLHGTAPPQLPPPVEVSLDETQLLAGMIRKPRSQAAQVRAAVPIGPPPRPNTTVAVIIPPAAPVTPPKHFPDSLSRLRPPAAESLSTHKDLRENLPIPVTKSCVEMPPTVPAPVAAETKPVQVEKPVVVPPPVTPKPAPTNAAAKASRQRLISVVILMAGGIMIGVGYSSNNAALRFLGFIAAITGFFALLFALRFGSIIAPPRD